MEKERPLLKAWEPFVRFVEKYCTFCTNLSMLPYPFQGLLKYIS